MDSEMRLSPEFALTAAMRTVAVLTDPDSNEVKFSALQPKKDWAPPFAFYIPTEDSEETDLDGPAGLQHFTAQVQFVGGTHRGMQLLCQRAKKAVRDMTGETYSTETPGWPRGSILVEEARAAQSSPDLYDVDVGFYRRIYTVQIDYQTEEVYEDEEVPSA